MLFLAVLRIPVVWTVHNLYNHERKNRRLERFAYGLAFRTASKVIVHCGHAASRLRSQLRAAATRSQKIVVVPHGNYASAYPNAISRADARARLGLAEGDFVFLSLGAIREYKGGVELADAFAAIDPPRDTKLVIAGPLSDDRVRRRLCEQMATLGDRALLRPDFVAREDIQIYLNAADVFVAPFRDILTSGSVILALTFGKPVIAPRIGCLPETLGEASDLLYDLEEENGLKRTLRSAIERRNELEDLGTKSRAVAERLSWHPIAERTLECYGFTTRRSEE
jgi:glycosyltransferase involved in cell wall biosynthesis